MSDIFTIVLASAIGFAVVILVAVKPKLFWIPLIIAAILGSGSMISGYALIDEFLLGCTLLGGLISIFTKRYPRNIASDDVLHITIFLLLIFYLILQSVRGMVLLDDLRMTRYVIYFIMLGVLSFMIFRGGVFPNLDAKNILLVLVWSGVLYFVLYLTHGIYFEAVLGPSGRFAKQGILWSGSAYAMFPLVVLMPAAILLFENSSKKYRFPSIFLLIISVLTASYFYSRIGFTSIIVFSLLALIREFNSKRVFSFVFCLLILLSAIILWSISVDNFINTPHLAFRRVFSRDALVSMDTLSKSSSFLVASRESDLDRNQQVYAALDYLKNNLSNNNISKALFGEGYYLHRTAIIPYIKQRKGKISSSGIVRPIGIAAFIIDTGIVGPLLLLFNLWMTLRALIKNKVNFNNLIIIVPMLLISVSWLFISNILDSILFFLLLMPLSLSIRLALYSPILSADNKKMST